MERKALTCLKLGILFLYVEINIGRWEILPKFVGALLLFASIQSHAVWTEAEIRIKPLFLLLAADYFLHWIMDFENILETLLVAVVYCYGIFVLSGEVAARIRPRQPDRAWALELLRIGIVLLNTISFMTTAYEKEGFWIVPVVALLVLQIFFLVAVWGIRAQTELE